jgi:3-oxoacyl-[acyl-carrier protein] reductase
MILKDKTVFLTGAARGIGATCARHFVEQGAKVMLIDRDKSGLQQLSEELNTTGENTLFAVVDITDAGAVAEAVKTLNDTWGHVDILVNNAGITRDALTAKMSSEDFDAVIAVNLKGPMICTQAVFPYMKAQNNGVILNAASVSALGNVGQANYAASKSGLIAMTKTWAMEFARYQIRVNAVGPGFTDTEMLRTIPAEVMEKIVSKVPLRRLAKPEEIAATYAFLGSDQAAFITGQVLYVDGGLTCGF